MRKPPAPEAKTEISAPPPAPRCTSAVSGKQATVRLPAGRKYQSRPCENEADVIQSAPPAGPPHGSSVMAGAAAYGETPLMARDLEVSRAGAAPVRPRDL